jgi:hypothetical protein
LIETVCHPICITGTDRHRLEIAVIVKGFPKGYDDLIDAAACL